MNLTEEQKLVGKEGVKVYLVSDQRMGKVEKVTPEMITVNIGTAKEPQHIRFTPKEYDLKIMKEEVVLQKRVIWTKNGDYGGVKPLDNPPVVRVTGTPVMVAPLGTSSGPEHVISPSAPTEAPSFLAAVPKLEIGYINVKSGRFRLTPKEGYVRIEYREVTTQRVSLDLTDEQIKMLEEMGIKE